MNGWDMSGWDSLVSQNYDYFWDLCVVLGITVCVSLILKTLTKKLLHLFSSTNTVWDDVILESVSAPAQWMIWVIGSTWALDITVTQFVFEGLDSTDSLDAISIARQLALVVLVAWLLWRLINRIEAQQLTGGADPTTVQLIGKISKLAVIILIILPVFQLLGISISGILAFGGMGGLIVGLAAKDLLANFFGSLIIYLDRPFKVGDWIRSADRDIEGVVENIGFRVTRIRTFDKRPLYVPNSIFTTILVENPSRMLNRRIYENIGVRYSDARKIPLIMNDIRDMLKHHEEVDDQQTMIVNFNGFGASSLDFFIYCYTHTTNWVKFHEVKQDVLLKTMDIIHHHEADCAFPTRTLLIDQIPDELNSLGHN